MKKVLLIISFLALFISCDDASKKKDKETSKIPTLALADFDAKAGEWLGKEIQVEGIVDHVCKHGGKKILLVDDEGDIHVESDKRFDDAIVGDKISLKGIVTEFRVDESYLLKKEEDHIQKHKEGADTQEIYEKKMAQLQYFRDSMEVAKVKHLSYYSVDYISHEIITEGEEEKEVEEEKEEGKTAE